MRPVSGGGVRNPNQAQFSLTGSNLPKGKGQGHTCLTAPASSAANQSRALQSDGPWVPAGGAVSTTGNLLLPVFMFVLTTFSFFFFFFFKDWSENWTNGHIFIKIKKTLRSLNFRIITKDWPLVFISQHWLSQLSVVRRSLA